MELLLLLFFLSGGSHIESSLYNIDLIQRLVKQHETNMYIDRENSPIDTNIRPKVNINAEYEAKLVSSLFLASWSSSKSRSSKSINVGFFAAYGRIVDK